MNGNYIKISRSILEWGWYSDIETCRVFIHFLLKANWKDANFRGVEIKRGSFVSSVHNLSLETGLSERKVRTAILHLKTTGEVTSKSYPKFTVFTIKNYDLYQMSDKQNDKQVTSNRQASDKQVTTIEEGKKGRREESNNKYMCAFEELWGAYPRKKEKAKAYKCYQARLSDGFSEDELMLAVKRYAQECKAKNTEEQYVKLAATFLGPNTPFVDYLGDYKPPSGSAGNKFKNFEERKYDMTDLEKQILGKRSEEKKEC